jgi:hypothetical protein
MRDRERAFARVVATKRHVAVTSRSPRERGTVRLRGHLSVT